MPNPDPRKRPKNGPLSTLTEQKNSLKIIKSLWNVLQVVLGYFVENFVQILYELGTIKHGT